MDRRGGPSPDVVAVLPDPARVFADPDGGLRRADLAAAPPMLQDLYGRALIDGEIMPKYGGDA